MRGPAIAYINRASAAASLSFIACCLSSLGSLQAAQDVLIVKGAAGDSSYVEEIDAVAQLWTRTAERAGHSVQTVEPTESETPQLERLRNQLSKVQSGSDEPLWLVLIGHGSAQGRSPKFALSGPDLTPEDLSTMLSTKDRPTILVAGFASSGAFIAPLAGPQRVLLSATRSGREDNWVRFPRFFAEAVSSLEADMDSDGQVSVFEAWLHACRSVDAYYKQEGRMVTEHSILCEGSAPRPLDCTQFAVKPKEKPRFVSPVEAAPLASQWHLAANPVEAGLSREARDKRQFIETELFLLRRSKAGMAPEEYQTRLEALLLQLNALHFGSAKVEKQRPPSEH